MIGIIARSLRAFLRVLRFQEIPYCIGFAAVWMIGRYLMDLTNDQALGFAAGLMLISYVVIRFDALGLADEYEDDKDADPDPDWYWSTVISRPDECLILKDGAGWWRAYVYETGQIDLQMYAKPNGGAADEKDLNTESLFIAGDASDFVDRMVALRAHARARFGDTWGKG